MRINKKLIKRKPSIIEKSNFPPILSTSKSYSRPSVPIKNSSYKNIVKKNDEANLLHMPLKKEPYDIVICVAPKDYFKLKYNIKSIYEHLSGFENIYIISPTDIDIKLDFDNLHFFKDREVLDIPNANMLKHRPGWIYQQFLKLFQNITKNNYFLTVDSDIIFNKNLDFFNEQGQPIWYSGWDQTHMPYFLFQEKMFDFGKIIDKTFVCDMNFMNKKIINNMLLRYNYTVDSFVKKSVSIIDGSCYPAEPELYGSYAFKYFPYLYEMRKIRNSCLAKNQSNSDEQVFTEQEFENMINQAKRENYDIIAIHSWFDGKPSYI
ncbi:MAG: hypothetical protein ACOCV1_05805 [Bacillota bacterium]